MVRSKHEQHRENSLKNAVPEIMAEWGIAAVKNDSMQHRKMEPLLDGNIYCRHQAQRLACSVGAYHYCPAVDRDICTAARNYTA